MDPILTERMLFDFGYFLIILVVILPLIKIFLNEIWKILDEIEEEQIKTLNELDEINKKINSIIKNYNIFGNKLNNDLNDVDVKKSLK